MWPDMSLFTVRLLLNFEGVFSGSQPVKLGCSKQVLWFDVHGPSMFLIRDFISQNKNVDREHQLFAHVLATGHFC